VARGFVEQQPILQQVAAVSVGLVQGVPLLDLDYSEDSQADVDLNVVMDNNSNLLEIQGTAEGAAFSRSQLNGLLDLAEPGLHQLMQAQRQALSNR
jgi:ribonuclease PH